MEHAATYSHQLANAPGAGTGGDEHSVCVCSWVRSVPSGGPRRAHGVVVSGRVLVVDDDPAIAGTVADVLDFAGDAVVTAGDGAEALDRLDAGFEPCAILLDLRVPGMDGWGFAASVRARGRTLGSMVVMTVDPKIGAGGCLPKPFELDDLLAAADRLCG